MSQRIDYIDLMKGICIFLIILLHLEINLPYERLNEMLRVFRIPLYFFLSGLFFKEYSCFGDFFIRKTNKLIIPFLFFPWLQVFADIFNDQVQQDIHYFSFLYVYPYNYPVWFLRCLFLTYIIFYIYNRYCPIKNKYIKMILLFVISYTIWRLTPICKFIIIYKLNIFPAFISLPFFYSAYLLRQNGFLSITYKKIIIIPFICLCILVSYLTAQNGINYSASCFGNNFVFLYIGAFSGIGVVWGISYILRKVFYFSYIGRYSIIVLGTHFILHIIFSSNLHIQNPYWQLVIILLLNPILIYIFRKYFPYVTAQKDLIKYENGKITLGLADVLNNIKMGGQKLKL